MKKYWNYETLLTLSKAIRKYKNEKTESAEKLLSSADPMSMLHLIKEHHKENKITKKQENFIILLFNKAGVFEEDEDQAMIIEIFYLAVKNRKYKIVQHFIDLTDDNDSSLLHNIFWSAYKDVLISKFKESDQKLLEMIEDSDWIFPNQSKAQKIFKILDNPKLDLSHQDKFGNTVFHYIAMCASEIDYDLSKIFDRNVANIVNDEGKTPYYLIYGHMNNPTYCKPPYNDTLTILNYLPPIDDSYPDTDSYCIEVQILGKKSE